MPSVINKIIYMDKLLSYSASGDQNPKGVEVEGHLRRSVCVSATVSKRQFELMLHISFFYYY